MKDSSELTKAQAVYKRAAANLDRAMMREVAALARLDRAQAVYEDALKAKAYAADAKAYAAGANKAEQAGS